MLLPTSAQPSPLMDDAHSHIYYTHYERYGFTCIFRDYSSVSFGDLRKKKICSSLCPQLSRCTSRSGKTDKMKKYSTPFIFRHQYLGLMW